MKRLIILAAVLFPVVVHAGSYYLDGRIQSQARENSLSEREVPFDVYMDAGLAELPQQGTFDVSFKNNHTFNSDFTDGDEFDLYQAVFRMQNLGGVADVSAGRQFLSPGFHTYLVDGLSTTIGKDDWPIVFTLFGGIPRYIESGDFHGEAGLVSGMTIETQIMDHMHTKFSMIYDKLDIDAANWKENETVLVGMSHSHYFGGNMAPTLYGTMEYDTAGSVIETGIMGFGLQPHRRIYWNIEGGHYNTNRDRTRTTIFSLYANGPLYQG